MTYRAITIVLWIGAGWMTTTAILLAISRRRRSEPAVGRGLKFAWLVVRGLACTAGFHWYAHRVSHLSGVTYEWYECDCGSLRLRKKEQ